MYIGTSLGRCLPSILRGEVKREEVGIIITRTNAPEFDRYIAVVGEYYRYGSFNNGEYDYTGLVWEEVDELATYLWDTGRIHQPRINSNNTGYLMPEMKSNIWMEVTPVYTGDNESVVQAYEHYQMLRALTN